MPAIKGKGKAKGKGKVEESRPIIHPEPSVEMFFGDKKMTAKRMEELLGWETEEHYIERMKKEFPNQDEKRFAFGDDFLLKDEYGNKVRCWQNCRNRYFTESWARTLAQTILRKEWRKNLENIIVGKSGIILSGQHRGVGLILAKQIWEKQNAVWSKFWPDGEEPFIETLVAFGADEDPDTLRTLDNTKPRTLADVIYTSPLFDSEKKAKDKRELSRMLEKSVKLLFSRFQASEEATQHFQTHPLMMEFIDRHKKLLNCVRHIFGENGERGISNLQISAGEAAAMMYLMATSASDGDAYRTAEVPSEKKLSFDFMDRAEEFWVLLGSKSPTMLKVVQALAGLATPDGEGGSAIGRRAIIAKAWIPFSQRQEITDADLELRYFTDDEGIRHLDEFPVFGGADLGDLKPKKKEPDENPEGDSQYMGIEEPSGNGERSDLGKISDAVLGKPDKGKKGQSPSEESEEERTAARKQRAKEITEKLQKMRAGKKKKAAEKAAATAEPEEPEEEEEEEQE